MPSASKKYGAIRNWLSQKFRFGIRYHFINANELKMRMIADIMRKTAAKIMCFLYRVAVCWIAERLDLIEFVIEYGRLIPELERLMGVPLFD